jgi:lipopolysaccharide biosynthesis glycosyltransferase
MVKRHLTIPYEFVCLTDDQHPIKGVRSIVQPHGGYKKGWWHKVHMFDPSLNLKGRILYFDLDVVIHNNIDKLISNSKNEFLGIRDFNRKFNSGWNILNSSAMSWTAGLHTDIYTVFKTDPLKAQRLHGDQDWIWQVAKSRIKFWPDSWIQSYKWEIRKREELTVLNGKRQFRTTDHTVEVNPDCCVTVFHGDPKPQDVKDKFVVDNWC